MGRKLNSEDMIAPARSAPAGDEIPLFAADAGAGDRDASALRRALQLPVTPRIWHRVFPYLPRERRVDGSLLLWHPDEAGWQTALERVHAGVGLRWRRSGAYVLPPGSDRVVLRDFREFDETDLMDWSIAVPDQRFRELCGQLRGELCPLSELVARWALEVGPQRAGLTLAMRQDAPPNSARH